MERQKARWRGKSEDVPDVLDARMLGVLQMTLKKLSHFMWRLVYTDNFFMWQFLFATLKLTCQLFSKCSCHIKLVISHHLHGQIKIAT